MLIFLYFCANFFSRKLKGRTPKFLVFYLICTKFKAILKDLINDNTDDNILCELENCEQWTVV